MCDAFRELRSTFALNQRVIMDRSADVSGPPFFLERYARAAYTPASAAAVTIAHKWYEERSGATGDEVRPIVEHVLIA